MSFPQGSRLVLAALGAATLLGGCTQIRGHQGYLVDETLISAIQPGVDNKESVVGTLGRPSFVGQFDEQERDWYYVSRDTRQLAFRSPRAPPPASSGRDGQSPAGGDDLGRRRDVGSAQPSADDIMERAAAAYAAVRTLRADFQQTSVNPVLRRTTTSRGTIFQRRPDRFLMRFSEPAGDLIVSDGTYIWVYYPSVDERQVIRMPAGAGGAGAVDLQAQFLGDPTTRFRSTLIGAGAVGDRPAHVVLLTPKQSESFRTLKVWIDERDHLVARVQRDDALVAVGSSWGTLSEVALVSGIRIARSAEAHGVAALKINPKSRIGGEFLRNEVWMMCDYLRKLGVS